MKNVSENNKQQFRGSPLRATFRFAFGALSIGMFGSAAHAVTEFHPRAEVNVSWTDNISLVSDDDPTKESDYIGQVNPGFLWTQKSPRFETSFEYTMQNLFYMSDSERNSTYHQGSLSAQAEVAREYFFIEASANYSQQLINPEAPISGNNLFLTSNTADALAAQVTPILRHEFDALYFDARYTRGMVNYKGHKNGGNADALQDADTSSINVLMSNPKNDELHLTWQATYNSQLAQYDQAPDFRYDEANLELGLLVGKDLRLIGRGGLESDPSQDQTTGGLEESTWEAGFQWRPGRRTNIEAFYGERFYGPTYKASISHEARRVVVDMKYSEGPSTQAQELAGQQQTFGNVVPGTSYFARPTSDAFVHKTLEGSVHIKGSRTDISIGVTDYRRAYLNSSLNAEHSQGASLDFSRALSSQSRFEVGGSYSDTDLRDGQEFRDINFRIELNRQVSQRIKVALSAHRIQRTGDLDYDANVATLSLVGEW